VAIRFKFRHEFQLSPDASASSDGYHRKRVEADDTTTLLHFRPFDGDFPAGTYFTVFDPAWLTPAMAGRCLYIESNGNFDLELTTYDSVAAATSLEEFTFRNQIGTRQYKIVLEGIDIRLVRVRAVTATRRISGAVGAL